MAQNLSPEAAKYAGVDQLRDELSNAPEAPPLADDYPPPIAEEPADPGDGGGRGYDGDRPIGELYQDCPVTPLGVRGDYTYVLDVLGQLRAIKKAESQALQSVFGHQIPQLIYHFPIWKKSEDGNAERARNRFDQTAASMTLYQAASECGVFNPDNAVRGVGAWTDDDGKLVYHAGDKVLYQGEWTRPGRVEGKIYPAFPPIPKPDPKTTAPDPVPPLLDTLRTWNWTSSDLHPFLALGMIATQMICGALDWRPVFWLLAPAGSGKSELQKLIKMMHGDDGLVQTTDATKSGITSKLGQSSLPVAVDELEPGDERSTKERDIIQLARVAASGGEWFRGSSDQTGVGGKVYSSFLFSSILIPGVMKTQDVQRLIRLELGPLKKGQAKLNLQPRTWRARGARLKALLIDRWDTFPERLALWRHALELAEVTGRDADNWGTVLAMADMAQSEDMPAEDFVDGWCRKVAFLANADRAETLNDADEMLLHLMSQRLDPFRRGQQHNIAQWVMTAAALPGAPSGITGSDDPTDAERRSRANVVLAQYGLRVYGTGQDAEVFIMNKPIQALKDLFRDTQWANGVWQQSSSRVPGANRPDSPPTLAGQTSRGFKFPVTSIPGLSSFPMDRDKDVVAQEPDDAQNPANWT